MVHKEILYVLADIFRFCLLPMFSLSTIFTKVCWCSLYKFLNKIQWIQTFTALRFMGMIYHVAVFIMMQFCIYLIIHKKKIVFKNYKKKNKKKKLDKDNARASACITRVLNYT